jgi:hypothetical protein
MLFLDSSAIIAYNDALPAVVEYVDGSEPLFTSAICVYEVVTGGMRATDKSAHEIRQGFGGVRSLELNEPIALEGARLQAELRAAGEELAARDLLIAATARSTGAELVVADDDFDTSVLRSAMSVRNFGG